MTQTAVRELKLGIHLKNAIPTAAEIDAMLNAVNAQTVQQDLAPEAKVSPELGWTVAALAAGATAGCLGAWLLAGGWLAPLAAGMLGAAAGGMFAVMLWRASDDGGDGSTAATIGPSSFDDDLLFDW